MFTPNAKFASVDDAYTGVTALLAGSAFNATQKAAISISNVVHTNPADSTSPVTAYTVTLTGNYPASYDMRLGDLQRSAMRILTAAMHSEPFAQLATSTGRVRHQRRPVREPVRDVAAGHDRRQEHDQGELTLV